MSVVQVEAFKLPMQKEGHSTASDLQFTVLKHAELGYLVEPRLLRLPLKSVLRRARVASGRVFTVGGKHYLPLDWLSRKQKKKLAGIYLKHMRTLITEADNLFRHRVIEAVELNKGEMQ